MKQLKKMKFIEMHTTDLICERPAHVRESCTSPRLDGRPHSAHDLVGLLRTKGAVGVQCVSV